MQKILGIVLLAILFQSCQEKEEMSSINPVNWGKRTVSHELGDTLFKGTTYLSVYSQIYSQSEHKNHDLTVTVSMRNIDQTDTIYIDKAEYFDTHGKSIRTYFDKTIFIAPMETVEIVIDAQDQAGGTGGNFLFDWKVKPGTNKPLFEGIMISTSGQLGISFTTQGHPVE